MHLQCTVRNWPVLPRLSFPKSHGVFTVLLGFVTTCCLLPFISQAMPKRRWTSCGEEGKNLRTSSSVTHNNSDWLIPIIGKIWFSLGWTYFGPQASKTSTFLPTWFLDKLFWYLNLLLDEGEVQDTHIAVWGKPSLATLAPHYTTVPGESVSRCAISKYLAFRFLTH